MRLPISASIIIPMEIIMSKIELSVNKENSTTKLQIIRIAVAQVANEIHEYGLFALQQANEHNNITYGKLLIDALGKKADVKRVEKWLFAFGKFGMKGTELVFRDRKDIKPETIDAVMAKASSTPWYDYSEVEHASFKVDYLAILKSAMAKHKKAAQLQAEGKEVEIKHEGLFAEIAALIAKVETPSPVATSDHVTV
jgi:hypothetical protein